jgi:hypothetical protein
MRGVCKDSKVISGKLVLPPWSKAMKCVLEFKGNYHISAICYAWNVLIKPAAINCPQLLLSLELGCLLLRKLTCFLLCWNRWICVKSNNEIIYLRILSARQIGSETGPWSGMVGRAYADELLPEQELQTALLKASSLCASCPEPEWFCMLFQRRRHEEP